MTKAYSYTRMSTPEQLKGDSIRRQVQKANEYAAKRGWEVVDRYDDIGVSAFHGKNAQFGALSHFLAAVRAQVVEPGSALIVESIDRLSRQNVYEALPLLTGLVQHGITVVTLLPEQEYSKESLAADAGMSLVGALFVMVRAHEESKLKSMRVREAWKQKRRDAREHGKVATGRVPGWLTLRDGKVVVNEERAAVVREIFGWAKNGWGAYSISRRLNERKEKPWGSKKHAVWRESYIKKLLRTRTVLGEYQPETVQIESGKSIRSPDGDPIVGYYPTVVDLALFQEVGETLDARRAVGRGRKGHGYANLFTGLLKCRCGAGYRFVSKGLPPKGGTYLQCSVALAKGSCSMPLLRYEFVESFLLSAADTLDARRILKDASADQALVSARERRLELLVAQIADAERKIANLGAFVAEHGAAGGGVSIKKALDDAELDLMKARPELERLSREIDAMHRGSAVERREALSRLIQEIKQDDSGAQRRALAEELRRLIQKVIIHPAGHVVEEILDGGPDSRLEGEAPEASVDWKVRFGVSSQVALRKLVKERNIEAHFIYRTGAEERIDALLGSYYKVGSSKKMKEFKLVSS